MHALRSRCWYGRNRVFQGSQSTRIGAVVGEAVTPKRFFENILRNDPSVRDDKVVTFDNHATDAVLFSQVSAHSFLLSNGVRMIGPCFSFHRTVLSWKVRNVSDINERSLLLLKLLVPKVDIVVIGKGSSKAPMVDSRVLRWLRDEARVAYEVLATERAVEVYNFLNAEGRLVAAALIPPGRDELVDDETLDEAKRQSLAVRGVGGNQEMAMDVNASLTFNEPFKKSLFAIGDVWQDLKAMKIEEEKDAEANRLRTAVGQNAEDLGPKSKTRRQKRVAEYDIKKQDAAVQVQPGTEVHSGAEIKADPSKGKTETISSAEQYLKSSKD